MSRKPFGLCPVCELMATRDSGPCTRCRWYGAVGQLLRSALQQGNQADQDATIDVLREHAAQRQRFFSAMSQTQRAAVEELLTREPEDVQTERGRLF